MQEEKAYAKDLHPKLLGGMFFFFALGATGGVTSLLTSDKPILERYNDKPIFLPFLPLFSFNCHHCVHIQNYFINFNACPKSVISMNNFGVGFAPPLVKRAKCCSKQSLLL